MSDEREARARTREASDVPALLRAEDAAMSGE
jgi:hypothetical protein